MKRMIHGKPVVSNLGWMTMGCLILVSQPARAGERQPVSCKPDFSQPATLTAINHGRSSLLQASTWGGGGDRTTFASWVFDSLTNPRQSNCAGSTPPAPAACDETLRDLGLCSLSLLAWDHQNEPSHKDEKPHSPSATKGSPHHIFWIVPAFHVAYLKQFEPLTPREKFDEWAQGTYDPRGIGVLAFESATLEHSASDGFCGYGKGWGGYGKCFGSVELDANISSFFGDFLFPVIMHQDPRYFRLGQGAFRSRLFYAVSRVLITHSDSGHWVFSSSALSGSVLAAAASNLYYPRSDRGFGSSVSRLGLDLGNTALFNVAAEFWPDIKNKLHHVF